MTDKKRGVFSAEEIAVFCEQLSLILSAGIPLCDGIEALESDYAGTNGALAFRAMVEEIKMSGSLASALEAADVFPVYLCGMVRIGEESGRLDTVVAGLAAHYQQEAQIRRTAVSTVRYPMTLMAVMALVVTVLIFQVMPIFEQAFGSLSGGISAASASMMNVGRAAGMTVFAVMLAVLFTGVILWGLLRDGKRPQLRAKLLVLVPALGRIQRMMNAQRLASVLSMLLGSGFPLEQALELLPDVYEGENEKQMMRTAGEKVLNGQAIGDVIEETGWFDPLQLRMIRVGFSAGQADAALEKTAQLLATQVDDAMGRIIALIEPALVIVLSALIGAILLSVMMPLASVLSAMA